jgi:hypothetical protein
MNFPTNPIEQRLSDLDSRRAIDVADFCDRLWANAESAFRTALSPGGPSRNLRSVSAASPLQSLSQEGTNERS